MTSEPKLTLYELRDYQPRYFGRRLVKPQKVYVLKDENGSPWMSDCPQERVYMGSVLPRVKPGMRVLTAGLGLGIFTTCALNRGAHVTVVEQSQAVIDAVEIEHPNLTVEHGDVREWMQWVSTTTRRFDFTYLDIWAGGGDTEQLDRYKCIKLAEPISKSVVCWQLWSIERTMLDTIKTVEQVLTDVPDMPREMAQQRTSYGGWLLPGLYLANPDKNWTSPRSFIRWLRANPELAHAEMYRLFIESCDKAARDWQHLSSTQRTELLQTEVDQLKKFQPDPEKIEEIRRERQAKRTIADTYTPIL